MLYTQKEKNKLTSKTLKISQKTAQDAVNNKLTFNHFEDLENICEETNINFYACFVPVTKEIPFIVFLLRKYNLF